MLGNDPLTMAQGLCEHLLVEDLHKSPVVSSHSDVPHMHALAFSAEGSV